MKLQDEFQLHSKHILICDDFIPKSYIFNYINPIEIIRHAILLQGWSIDNIVESLSYTKDKSLKIK